MPEAPLIARKPGWNPSTTICRGQVSYLSEIRNQLQNAFDALDGGGRSEVPGAKNAPQAVPAGLLGHLEEDVASLAGLLDQVHELANRFSSL